MRLLTVGDALRAMKGLPIETPLADVLDKEWCEVCSSVATCVGQFNGSCTPTYACDECCDHFEHVDGQCEPIDFWEEGV